MHVRRTRGVPDQTSDGFTLIELLIVIVVLGILAATVLFAVGNAKSDSVAARCKADVRTLQAANEAYKASHGTDAPDIDALVPGYLKSAPSSGVTFSAGVTNPASVAACSGSLALTPPAGPSVHLASASGTTSRTGGSDKWSSTVAVSVVDDGGASVPGALVTGTWSDGLTPNSCTTGGAGTCSFTTTNHSTPDTSTEEVWTLASITKSGYDSGSNAVSSVACARSGSNNGATDCS